jgi:SAM-dependent methyltransferase
VLDIGCGMGRLAVALSKYLGDEGCYEGVDIVPAAIEWGRSTIASRFPRFHFTLADVFNAEYNPRGSRRAAEYTFPFPDNTFDLIVLCSVFTHLLPEDVEHYISEVTRMLAPGGRCFATVFLLNDESRLRLASGDSAIDFKNNFGTYATVSTRVPELSIAYDEEYLQHALAAAGLGLVRIRYGGWCGREPLWSSDGGAGDQDIVIAGRREAA